MAILEAVCVIITWLADLLLGFLTTHKGGGNFHSLNPRSAAAKKIITLALMLLLNSLIQLLEKLERDDRG